MLRWYVLAWCCLGASLSLRIKGVCNDQTDYCACGTSQTQVALRIKRCAGAHRWKVSCYPCEDNARERACANYARCNSCINYQGRCETCPNGKFGRWCTEACQCHQDAACNKETGECFCPSGFTGVHCEIREGCQPPAQPEGVMVSMSSTFLPRLIQYSCAPGLRLRGPKLLRCQNNGSWDGVPPYCEKQVPCPPLPEVTRSVLLVHHPSAPSQVGSIHFNGTIAQYSCSEGYDLLGSMSVTCGDRGEWSAKVPLCLKVSEAEITCTTKASDILDDSSDTPVRVHCPPGCGLVPGSVVGSLQYHRVSVVCRAAVHAGRINNAGGPVHIVNAGSYADFISSTAHGITTSSFLNLGESFKFVTVNDTKWRIPEEGCPPSWTDKGESCIYYTNKMRPFQLAKNLCSNLGAALLSVSGEAALVDETAELLRKGGVERVWVTPAPLLNGDPVANTNISGSSPGGLCPLLAAEGEASIGSTDCNDVLPVICSVLKTHKQAECDDLGPVEYGTALVEKVASQDHFLAGTRITYSCKELHYLSGHSSLICQANGVWDRPKPRCIPVVTCTEPAVAPHGTVRILPPVRSVDPRTTHVGRSSRPGRVSLLQRPLSISSTVVFPETEERNITLPPGHYRVGSRAEYDCLPQYQLSGSTVSRCLSSGKWSGIPATCIPVCGRSDSPRSPLIFNGNVSDVGQWPWQAAISVRNNNTWLLNCGGTLISESYVLTAAHCVTFQDTRMVAPAIIFQIALGKHFRNNSLDDYQVQVRKVREIHVFLDYNPATYENDIALILLDEPVILSPRVRPVCLPNDRSARVHLQQGRLGVVTGWGLTETGEYSSVLTEAVLPVVEPEACQRAYEDEGVPLTITETMFCAGHANATSDSCSGDSGGPLVFLDDSITFERRWIIEGVVSWGSSEGCAIPNQYGGFTKVYSFLDWIRQFI